MVELSSINEVRESASRSRGEPTDGEEEDVRGSIENTAFLKKVDATESRTEIGAIWERRKPLKLLTKGVVRVGLR